MKKILITGANSYIGTSFEKHMTNYEEYQIDTVDMIDGTWRDKNFSEYDVVFHVAGIAHIKETKENAHLYYDVNRDLAIETAKKAKSSGVGQFILLSSMSVYGVLTGKIDNETVPMPNTNYGKSKLEADLEIQQLESDNFTVTVVRPPMVYGYGCKGNYVTLSRFATKMKLFPKVKNERSMIYIYNLCEFVKMSIENKLSGIYLPQNKEYVSTEDMIRKISKINNNKIFFVGGFENILKKISIGLFKKVFGDLTYEKYDYGFEYNIFNFDESLNRSELG